MKYSEFESISRLETKIAEMEDLLELMTLFPNIINNPQKVENTKASLNKLKQEIIELKNVPDEFNKIFAQYGWIAYDSLNNDFMKSEIQLAKEDKIEAAIEKFKEYYDFDRIKFEIVLFNRIEETRIRLPIIENAFVDYQEKRLYAVIPIILMMIDGIVNDINGKGFHSENQEFDAWESITTIDNGIEVIGRIFRKGRYKTRIETIEEPYRNGILHGIDLGYANEKVALKAWHYLFVVRDWATAKKNEETRIAKFKNEQEPQDMERVVKTIENNDAVRRELDEWKPRIVDDDYINNINLDKRKIIADTPEKTVSEFIYWLSKKNFKELANLFWKNSFYDDSKKIAEIKERYQNISIGKYVFKSIITEAPVFTEILIACNANMKYTFRMVYESINDDVAIPSLKNGLWKIVFIKEA
ncbi:MAG: hypothetical protein ACYC1A_07210 [Spirochaetales bacterium]